MCEVTGSPRASVTGKCLFQLFTETFVTILEEVETGRRALKDDWESATEKREQRVQKHGNFCMLGKLEKLLQLEHRA